MHQIDPEKIILGGWSFGGGLTPAGAAQNPGVRRIFTISGRNFGKEARKIEADPEYAKQVSRNLEGLRTPKGPINYQADLIPDLIAYQDSLDYEKLAPVLKDRDILLIGGWNDDLSPIEDYQIPFYRALVENGANKVRIEAVHDGHEFSESKDQLVKIITDWLREEWSDQ
jgi:dipeptidyl aminopeptidase/acylaminoacyl peptidase